MLKNENAIRHIIGYEYVNCTVEHEQDELVKRAFNEISIINERLFDCIPFPVTFVESDPYHSAAEMRKRVIEERHIYIYTEYSGHPYLSQWENNIGRAVHDIYAHLVCGCPFTFVGEYNAYLEQRKHYPEHLWKVLFAEIPAQTAAYYFTGSFDYKQRAIEAPEAWLKLCHGLKRDYSKNSVLNASDFNIERVYK